VIGPAVRRSCKILFSGGRILRPQGLSFTG
jgi:hypothetical protein